MTNAPSRGHIVRNANFTARVVVLYAALSIIAAGCASRGPTASAPPKKFAIDDLDQLALVYADRHTTVIATACDRIVRETPDPRQRLLAGRFKLINCSSVYDIATSPDAFPPPRPDPRRHARVPGLDRRLPRLRRLRRPRRNRSRWNKRVQPHDPSRRFPVSSPPHHSIFGPNRRTGADPSTTPR